jgi:predicted outer membrane protein
MDRRTFGSSMLAGALGLAAAPALAQPGYRRPAMGDMTMGPAEERHARDTLMIGTVALETSRIALTRAGRPLVRQFAEFEVEENTTLAQIIGEITGIGPPPPTPADRRLIERLQRVRGPQFDREYLLGQIDGHRRALDVQERYLSNGRNRHHRHIAMLARGRIREHLRELDIIQRVRG